MKLNDLITARGIILSHKDEKMSSFLAYKLMKIIKASEEEDAFYKAKLQEIVDEYALKDEEGKIKTQDGNILVQPAHVGDFNKAYDELQNLDVKAPDIKISIHELGVLKFSPSELYMLDSFIEE